MVVRTHYLFTNLNLNEHYVHGQQVYHLQGYFIQNYELPKQLVVLFTCANISVSR